MEKIGSTKPDNLIAGQMYIATGEVTLKEGSVYKVGSVIALNSEGLGVLVNSNTENKKIYGILPDEFDATNSDIGAPIYLTGQFNQNVLIFGGDDTFEIHKEEARKLGLFFVDSQPQNLID